MDETVATQKIISFLQSALLKQKDLQQYLHFRPGADPAASEELERWVKIILLEMEFGGQILYGYFGIVAFDIVGDFFKCNPVHCPAQFF